GAIVNYVLGQLVDRTGLSGTDRVLGACFGLLRGILIVAAMLFFLDTFTGSNQTDWWKESKLIPHFRFVVDWFFQQLQANSGFLNSTLNLEQIANPATNAVPASTTN
ncbi:CvpA family protein, partial [Aggregatibacter actinomycetemcomitans]